MAATVEDVLRAGARALLEVFKVGAQAVGQGAAGYFDTALQATPPNWEELTGPQIVGVSSIMAELGWSLAWTPPTDVLLALLASEDRARREEILIGAEGRILDDLDRLLRNLEPTPLRELHRACREALEAHRSGLLVPAQATATAALGHAVEEHLGYAKLAHARKELRRLNAELSLPHLYRRVAIRAALGRAIEGFDERRGGQPNQRYNRHRSAHRVDDGQYRPENALASVMLAVSVLADLHDHIARPELDPVSAALHSSERFQTVAAGALRQPRPSQ